MAKLPFKTHRVRLRDDEIKLVAEGLIRLFRKRDEEGASWQTQRKLQDLTRRFQEWGREEQYREKPFFTRRRF